MLDTSLIQHWEMPLHQQWAALHDEKIIDSINYSSGKALGFIHLRGHTSDAAFNGAIESVLGVSVPNAPKQTVYSDKAALLWLSPDEWLLVCAYESKFKLVLDLQDALKDVHAQVVDNSGGFMLMRVHGKEAATVLRHISPYNVLALQDGQCVSTVAKKVTVVMVKVSENDYAFIFRRSFADYLWRVLQKTAKPYGYAVQKSWQFTQPDWQRYTQ